MEREGSPSNNSVALKEPLATLDPFIAGIFGRQKNSVVEDELEMYLTEDIEYSSINSLSYWAVKKTIWPHLARMAMDYLAITATSASSERVFSVGRDLLGICRFRLKVSTMEWCVCLRSWLRSGLQLSGTRFTEEKNEDQVIDEVMLSDADDESVDDDVDSELDVSMSGE